MWWGEQEKGVEGGGGERRQRRRKKEKVKENNISVGDPFCIRCIQGVWWGGGSTGRDQLIIRDEEWQSLTTGSCPSSVMLLISAQSLHGQLRTHCLSSLDKLYLFCSGVCTPIFLL